MKKVFLTMFCMVLFGPLLAQTAAVATIVDSPKSIHNQPEFYNPIPLVGRVIDYARRHLAIRYRSGGTSTHGFDCSGFTRFCFNKVGLSLPHSSRAQATVGQAVEKDDAQPGDLILFKGHSASSSRIGHVGLITEVVDNRIRFIHSAWSGGVRYDYLHADYYQRRFMGIRRVATLLTEK